MWVNIDNPPRDEPKLYEEELEKEKGKEEESTSEEEKKHDPQVSGSPSFA